MNFRKIIYPSKEFYKFGVNEGAVKISNPQIEKWINEGIESVKRQIENGVESPYSMNASGDTIVFVFYFKDSANTPDFSKGDSFSVFIAKNYEEGEFFIEDITEMDKPLEEMTIEEFIKHNRNGGGTYEIGNYKIEITERYDN